MAAILRFLVATFLPVPIPGMVDQRPVVWRVGPDMVTARIWLRARTLATRGGRNTDGDNGIPATPIELSWGGGDVPTLAHAKNPGRSTKR
jgi:hypothetical protein